MILNFNTMKLHSTRKFDRLLRDRSAACVRSVHSSASVCNRVWDRCVAEGCNECVKRSQRIEAISCVCLLEYAYRACVWVRVRAFWGGWGGAWCRWGQYECIDVCKCIRYHEPVTPPLLEWISFFFVLYRVYCLRHTLLISLVNVSLFLLCWLT